MGTTYIQIDELAKLEKRFNAVLDEIPELRREMHEDIAGEVLEAVRGRIGGTGKVQDWQEAYVGTRGGYAAVRPRSGTDEYGDAVGYITNAIEHGHTQQPGRYVPALGKRLARESVVGRHFYSLARPTADRIAREHAEDFARMLVEKLKE